MEIVTVKCPFCKNLMYLKNLYLAPNEIIKRWACKDCVFMYPEHYFDEFKQFEDCVVRQ